MRGTGIIAVLIQPAEGKRGTRGGAERDAVSFSIAALHLDRQSVTDTAQEQGGDKEGTKYWDQYGNQK